MAARAGPLACAAWSGVGGRETRATGARLALLIGVESAGIVGAILAIPATVIAWAVVEELWPDRRTGVGHVPRLAGPGSSMGQPRPGRDHGPASSPD